MPVQEQNIKLVKSSVMLDVPEGGGPPSANVVVDGASNAIFDDISELARAGGNVSMRKTHVVVQTADTDGFFGTNVIVAEPPQDPRVSVTLFTTKKTFDTRAEAQVRVEAYLNKGAEYPGYLWENHIAGQRIIQIFQRPSEETPNVGETIVLIWKENESTQKEQYVRATAVSKVIRLFYDPDEKKDYPAAIVSVELSDALRYDFTGAPAHRSFNRLTAAQSQQGYNATNPPTKIRDTTVADAGSYVGVVPLTEAAALGNFTIKCESIYSQLVPSAQTETPIADSRPTQQAFAYVEAGDPVTQVITLTWTTTQRMFIGGSIMPKTLSITRDGVLLTDADGVLYNGSSQAGTVDYENGIVALSTNVFGTGGGTHTVVYTPSAKFEGTLKSVGKPITQETRSLSHVLSLEPAPKPGSLTVSYMVARRWYVLRDYGGGKLVGSDTAYGAGTLNFSTGTVSVTLGALPDVGSSIIFQWVETSTAAKAEQTPLRRFSRWAMPMNTDGNVSNLKGSKAIVPSGLTITWMGPDGQGKSATDDGYGQLLGDAQGRVDYTEGVIWWSPNLLPAKDTIISMDINSAQQSTASGVPVFGGTITANIAPRSIYIELPVSVLYSGREYNTANSGSSSSSYASQRGYGTWWGSSGGAKGSHSYSSAGSAANVNVTFGRTLAVRDDGAGNLYVDEPGGGIVNLGTINYTTGVIELQPDVPVPPSDLLGPIVSFTASGARSSSSESNQQQGYTSWYNTSSSSSSSSSSSFNTSWTERWNDCYEAVNGTRTVVIGAQQINVRYRTAGASQDSISVPMLAIALDCEMQPYFTLGVVRFNQGNKTWLGSPSGALLYDISPTTGVGTVVGEVLPSIGKVMASTWPANTSPVITNFRAAQVAPGDGPSAPGYNADITFRTAAAPLRPGSFQILGRLLDGTTFNVSAGLDGKINGDRCVGSIDYEVGLVRLFFIKRLYDADHGAVENYAFLGIPGLTWAEVDLCNCATLRYNAVSYSYLPLDAELLGIDPVRLPSDGRVPIFRAGGFAVVGNTQTLAPQTVNNLQTVDCGRTRLSRVRVIQENGLTATTGYTTNLDAGTVTFTDVSTYNQPIRIEHRVEDMAVVRDAQISGELSFTRALTHNYPSGTSYVSSALIAGDLRARVERVFDQSTWNGSWSDDLAGSQATATYNHAVFPVTVTNAGAVTERWIVRFTSTTAFEVIGENVGVIATGNTSTDCEPLNPVTEAPYFKIQALGWGSGWAAGNVLRINTIGAQFPVWVVRTVQQGPETINDDSFTLLVRGDVDAP